MEFFHKGGGGFRGNPKVLGHFCAPTILILGRKRGGGVWTKSRNFWALFTLIFVKYGKKKCTKSSKKNQPTKKCPKSSKSLGGEGQTFLEEVHN